MSFKSITVRVEPCDIRGADTSAWNNPIVRAIRRRLNKPAETRMFSWIGRVQIDGRCYYLPTEADNADTNFTRTGSINPFEFSLSNEPVPCHEACARDRHGQQPTKPKSKHA